MPKDSFKVTPLLTLNYGLRYEYQDPSIEAGNNMSNFDVASGKILLAGRGGASAGIIKPRKNDFSPRFGFAYILDPKTVVRAGGAIFYSPENDGREDFSPRTLRSRTRLRTRIGSTTDRHRAHRYGSINWIRACRAAPPSTFPRRDTLIPRTSSTVTLKPPMP